jgi:DNA-binding CsgD family transcriptional regulator
LGRVLCRAISRLSFIVNDSGVSGKTKTIWNIIPLLFVILAILQLFLWETVYSIYPVIIAVTTFISISLWFNHRNSKTQEHFYKNKNNLWILFLFFSLLIAGIEIILKIYFGFLGQYTINIPIIFLSWNFLSMSQFKDNMANLLNSTDLSKQLIINWNLTDREVEISKAIMRGDSNKEIASDLNISFSTVKNHIYNIYKKTNAKSRVDLVNLFK